MQGESQLRAPSGQVNLRPTGNAFAGNLLVDGVLRNGIAPERAPSPAAFALPNPDSAPPDLFAAAGGSNRASSTVVVLAPAPAGRVPGAIVVTLAQGERTAGFRFQLPRPLVSRITAGALPTVTLLDGSALPGWLLFNPEQGTFTSARVPEGGLPLKALVTLDTQQYVMTVLEAQPAIR